MTVQKSKMARRVAGCTASYLVLTVSVIVVGIGPPLSLLFLPGVYVLIAPTPLLVIVGLAERGWLLSLPNIPGFIVLIGLYTSLAYVLTRSIVRGLSHRT